jgi:hypothetical protein
MDWMSVIEGTAVVLSVIAGVLVAGMLVTWIFRSRKSAVGEIKSGSLHLDEVETKPRFDSGAPGLQGQRSVSPLIVPNSYVSKSQQIQAQSAVCNTPESRLSARRESIPPQYPVRPVTTTSTNSYTVSRAQVQSVAPNHVGDGGLAATLVGIEAGLELAKGNVGATVLDLAIGDPVLDAVIDAGIDALEGMDS